MVMFRALKTLVFSLLLFSSVANAQSILGGSITWESLAGDQYNVKLNLYVDCYGLSNVSEPYPQTVDIAFNADASCTGAAFSAFSAPASNTGSTEISDLCPTELLNSSCNNPSSANLGVKKLIYETTVTLAAGCAWTASYSGMDWSFYFENLTPIFLQDAFIFSTINTVGSPYGEIDIIPIPSGNLIPYFCAGNAETHILNINLPAGYSAEYSLDEQYTSGTSGNVPTPIDVGFFIPAGLTLNPIDASSASIDWTPAALPASSPTQVYTIPINITITAPDGTERGTIQYSFLIAVRDCNITVTEFDPVPVTTVGTGVTYTNNSGTTNDAVEVCAGELLAFTVQASNINLSRNITITYEFNPPAPELAAITMTQQSLAPGIASFELQTTGAMANATPYTLRLRALDDQCPTPDEDNIELDIFIRPNIQITSTAGVICAGDVFSLEAEGAGSSNAYTWEVLTGGDATPPLTQNVAAQNVSPDSTTTYRVSTPLNTGACSADDLITVGVSLHRLQLSAINETCGQLGSIDLTPLGTNSANLTYVWSAGPGGSGLTPGQQDQAGLEGSPAGVTYSVLVTDVDNGCVINGSTSLTETSGPTFTLTSPGVVCDNTNATVVIDFTAGQAPFDIWFTNPVAGSPDFTAVPDPYNYSVPVSGNTTVSVLQVRDANGCVSDAASLPGAATITARPTVTSSFSAVAPLCVGDPLSLTIDHSLAGTYSVVYSIGGVAQPAIAVADNGTIDAADPTAAGTVTYDIESVSYNTAPACPSTDANNLSINVVTYALPTVSVAAGLSVSACAPNAAIAPLTLTGDGPWNIEYTLNGVAQPTLTIADSPAIPSYTYNWSVSASGTYCITNVSDANCSQAVSNQCFDVTINGVPSLVSFTINGASVAASPVDVCEGDNVDIEVEISPVGSAFSYEFIGTPDVGIGTYDNESSTFTTTIVASGDFTLELNKIYFTQSPQCALQVDDEIEVTVRPEIVVSAAAPVCDNVSETYTIAYTITTGTAPFTEVAGGSTGVFAGAVFTTQALTSGGAGGSWTFSDTYNCNTVTLTDAGYTCPIISDAGTMTAGTLTLCSPATAPAIATATQSSPYLEDQNDEVMFILHTDAADVLGSEIARSCGNPSFGDADTPLAFGSATSAGVVVGGVTYFISCVVGNNDGSGCVDETHPQVQFSSNTQSVVWYESGTATLSTPSGTSACQGQTVALDIDFTGTGPWNVVYSIDGVNQPALISAASPFSISVSTSGLLALVSLSSGAANCPGTVSGSEDVIIHPDIVVSQTDLICDLNAETYTIEFTVSTGTGPFTEAAGGIDGSFNNEVFTTNPISSGGTGGSWTFSDTYNCNTVTLTDAGYTCPIISDAGTMTAGTLTLCSPATAPAIATATQSTPYTLDGNDAFMYILHTNAANVLGSEIARSCGNPGFGDADTPLAFGAASANGVVVGGVTYYISCVVGNNDGSGCVDETHPQVQFSSNTQSVVWYESGTATLSAPSNTSACQGQTVALDIDFTGTGPWNVVYNIDGVNQPAINTAVSPFALSANASGTFNLISLTSSAANCPGTASGTESVVIHPLPSATISSDALICSGNSHCFDVTFTGEEPFSMEVNIPNVATNTSLNNLLQNYSYCVNTEGAYQIINVTDAFNCSSTLNLNFNLDAYPAVSANWLSNGESYCPNEPNITAPFSTSGDGPFTIDVTGPDPLIPPVISGNEIEITEPGNYTIVSITDVHGCINSTADVFVASELTVPTADAGSDAEQCSGLPQTIGTPSATGLTYSWSPTAGMGSGQGDDAQPVVTILNTTDIPSINIYVLTVNNGSCSNTDQVTVTVYPNPEFNITSSDNLLCFDAPNNTATLTAAPTSTGTYTYDWTPTLSILGATNSATVDIDPTTDEVFEVIASDDFGTIVCTTTESIAIEVNPPIQITNFISPTEMCALSCINDGSQDITFNVTGAFNNTYTSTIDGNSVSDQICYNDPINHTLLVTDAEGCEAFFDFTVDVRDAEVVMANTTQLIPFCYSDTDGQVEGINPEANQYLLSEGGQVTNVIDQSPFLFSGLTIGTYTLTLEVLLTGGQVCTADTTFTLDPDSPEITVSANPPAILGCPNNSIDFNADVTGGAGSFITYWNSCEQAVGCLLGTTNETAGQEFSLNLTQDTVIYFYALDAIGCSSDTITAIGTLSPGVFLLTQNGADTISTCQYDCEELTAFATGGAGALNVEWYYLNDVNDLTPTLIANSDTITECFLFDMLYEIRVIDEQCPSASISDTLWVTVHDTPEPIMDADGSGSCYPDTIGLSYTYLDPAYSDLSTCVWSLGNGAQISYCGDTAAVYTSPGSFFPSITVTSEFGCVGTDTLSSPITIRPYPEVDFTWDPQPIDVLHRDVHFQNLTAGAVAFEWNFYNAGESFAANPRWTFPDIETVTPYSICLTATNQYGCADTICQDVYVENVLQVFAPNTFTPDGDDLNDVFLPVVNGELDGTYRFWVFNRWGEIVFYTEEVGKAWTGGHKDGDYYIQDGYYLWKIEVSDLETAKKKTFEGNVFILR
jgi:hypothetical protein